MSYKTYPKAMTSNARRGRELNKERGGTCATAVGKQTGRILAAGAPLAKSRVRRMYKYLQRAETYYDPSDPTACGTISYLLWGGLAAKRWSEARWNEMQKEEKSKKLTFDQTHSDMDNHEKNIRSAYGSEVETRQMEVRASDDSEKMVLEGYAARFDEATNLGYFNEQIARGAFDDVLEDDVRFLLNHKGMPMARSSNGTLKMEVRDEGLWTRATLNDTQQSRDVYEAVKRGDIDQMSFAFTIEQDSHDQDANLRTIQKVKKMYDVSAVSYGAYPTTTIAARDAFSASQEPTPEPTPTPTPEPPAQPKTQSENRRIFDTTTPRNMNLHDLKGQRAAYYEEFVAIGQLADQEGRAMTEAEQERADKLDELITATDQKIKHKVREQDMVKRVAYSTAPTQSEDNEVSSINHRWSLSRAIGQIYRNEKLEGAELEWTQEAARELRSNGLQLGGNIAIPGMALRAGGNDNFQAASGDGSGFVSLDVPAAIAALRAPNVLEQLGTTTVQGQGNLKFPRIDKKATANDGGETAAMGTAGMSMDAVVMIPERASAQTAYSKQLLIQGGAEVDRIIANDLRAAMAEIEDTRGLALIMADNAVNDVSASSGSSSAGAGLALSMEQAVLADGADLSGAAYCFSPKAYQHFKGAAQVASVSGIYENGLYNGYRGIATPHLADNTAALGIGQAIFGNFAQGLLLARFGGIDLLVDPFSLASTARIQLHATRFFDVAVRQPGALCICDDVKA